jgi:acetyl/propionyl-CoA carboxylase alpha subunit
VLEESPSPAVGEQLRARLFAAASAFASAIGYRSAGTIEFLLDGDDFYFLELNGRIQVEHPVTELVTGADLVAWQLRLAEGESLVTYRHKGSGHAVEVRLYAEDPGTFLPQTGRLQSLRLPCDDKSQGIRVDSGVEEGDDIGLAYDPLIAKVVAHGPDRASAFDRLAIALAETRVDGVTTNLAFLRWLVEHPVVRSGEATTAFLTEHPALSQAPPRRPAAPWRHSWRLNLPAPPPAPPPDLASSSQTATAEAQASVVSPMPGTVISVEVEPGDLVRPRQPLVVLEAMKMEIPVHSPFGGTVKTVHAVAGERVAGGALLVELEGES